MKRNAFTLLELMLVMAIMGMMGTLAVGSYRGIQRGMEERGVMQNVNQFLKSAYSRAQIDRQPVVVYLWNETVSEETETKELHVSGHAVAVRPFGRVSSVQGNYIYDEFGDLRSNSNIRNIDETDENNSSVSTSNIDYPGNRTYIYKIDASTSPMRKTLISQTTILQELTEPVFGGRDFGGSGEQEDTGSNFKKIPAYCYVISSADSSGVKWQSGDLYGFEFQELVLPKNYIFGSNYSKTESSPIVNLTTIPKFLPGVNSGAGSSGSASGSSFEVCAIRPNAAGEMTAVTIGQSQDPRQAVK
jgi:prepilin-type N-terminal cleavage/methylation domain-containing protein